MKKIFFYSVLIGLTSLFINSIGYCKDPSSGKKLLITIYYSRHCGACLKVENEVLPTIIKKYGAYIQLIQKEIGEKKNLEELMNYNPKGTVPTIKIYDKIYVGVEQIQENLEKVIQDFISGKLSIQSKFLTSNPKESPKKKTINEFFKDLTLPTIITAGLIDGINPCAFAVIIFFISFLTVYKYRREQIIVIGIAYIFAVFLTYLLIGLGLFNAIYQLKYFYLLNRLFYAGLSLFCLGLGVFALYDYFRYLKTKDSKDQVLQLPTNIKKKINQVFGFLRKKEKESILKLLVLSLIIGFLVSILECACTGQVYIPTITLIMKDPSARLKAFAYLIVYNIMFIVPLLAIFILAIIGVSSQRLSEFLKQHLGLIKLMMAILFFALGILIWFI